MRGLTTGGLGRAQEKGSRNEVRVQTKSSFSEIDISCKLDFVFMEGFFIVKKWASTAIFMAQFLPFFCKYDFSG